MKIRTTGHLLLALSLILMLLGSYTGVVQAADEDPLDGRANGYVDEGFYDDSSDEMLYSNVKAAAGQSVVRGIDVSYHQGAINWEKARAAGVDFAMIRVGYRASGSGSLNEDNNFRTYLQGAANAGIQVGVYFFSQAITEAEAVEEANFITSRIAGYNIQLPVTIDYEYTVNSNGEKTGRLYNARLSASKATSIVQAFCSTTASRGYTPMVYANKSMLTSGLNATAIADQYKVWLAHYTSATNYTGAYEFWQYTDKGVGADYGCSSTYVDLDYWYCNGQAMYRMYNPNSGEHFYTADGNERNHLISVGWNYEGIGWTAPISGDPIYRLYNPNAGDHHYTMSVAERDNLVRLGWRDEGISCYSDVNRTVPLYRAYNPNAKAGSHNYTVSKAENDSLSRIGWSDEGIAWYGLK